MSIKGSDKWGEYHDFTGHEGNGCFWCGGVIEGYGRYRYCCPEHRQLYAEHYSWTDARAACIERNLVSVKKDGFWRHGCSCQDCGGHCIDGEYAVHHIVPLDGAYRALSWLNRHENLALLCDKCHMTRHKELNHLMRQLDKCENHPFQRFAWMAEQLELVLF